jgi:hypothetical protein
LFDLFAALLCHRKKTLRISLMLAQNLARPAGENSGKGFHLPYGESPKDVFLCLFAAS